jgi:hypothetical protein
MILTYIVVAAWSFLVSHFSYGIGNAAGGSKLCQSAAAVLIGCYMLHCKLSDTVPNLPLTFHLANEQLGIFVGGCI